MGLPGPAGESRWAQPLPPQGTPCRWAWDAGVPAPRCADARPPWWRQPGKGGGGGPLAFSHLRKHSQPPGDTRERLLHPGGGSGGGSWGRRLHGGARLGPAGSSGAWFLWPPVGAAFPPHCPCRGVRGWGRRQQSEAAVWPPPRAPRPCWQPPQLPAAPAARPGGRCHQLCPASESRAGGHSAHARLLKAQTDGQANQGMAAERQVGVYM